MLAQLDPQLIVVFAESIHLVTETAIPIVSVRCEHSAGIARLDELAAVQSDDHIRSRALLGDLAAIVSSGGTTGIPKGSIRDFRTYAAMVGGPVRPERRLLADGELAHLTQVLVDQTLLGHGTVVLSDTCAPAPTLDAIERHAVTDVLLVEPQLIDLVDHPDLARRDLSSLRAVLHIGASAPTALRLRARQRLGPVLVHTYGSSETGIVSALTQDEYDPADSGRFTSSGRLRPGVEVRFRNTDGTLTDCGTGRIEVRSPAVAGGYRNRPGDETATFVNGWCRTGDLGYLDEDAYLHIIGRADDIESTADAHVAPTDIEDALMRTASVRVASVVVDRAAGRWIAAVVAWPGQCVDLSACRRTVEDHYGDVVASHLQLLPMANVPLTGQGKPDRARIAALADEGHRGEA
jgi:fatty-acyl-CoA synthase